MAIRIATAITMAVMLGGCGSIGAIGIPGLGSSNPPPPIQPAPLPSVESLALPPPGSTPGVMVDQSGGYNQPIGAPATGSDQLAGGTQPAGQNSLAPPTITAPATQTATASLGRTDLLGGWTITSAGDSCQLFMTLTSWTGGYRASTRGCNSDTLKGISAWDLQGSQVILSGQGGTPVARLAGSGTGRFEGQTEGQGAPVSFYR
jgi:hypothetical protein